MGYCLSLINCMTSAVGPNVMQYDITRKSIMLYLFVSIFNMSVVPFVTSNLFLSLNMLGPISLNMPLFHTNNWQKLPCSASTFGLLTMLNHVLVLLLSLSTIGLLWHNANMSSPSNNNNSKLSPCSMTHLACTYMLVITFPNAVVAYPVNRINWHLPLLCADLNLQVSCTSFHTLIKCSSIPNNLYNAISTSIIGLSVYLSCLLKSFSNFHLDLQCRNLLPMSAGVRPSV